MKRETQRGLYLIVMKLCLFTLLTLTFLLLMAVNNPQIIRPSRTMAITLTGFVVLLALFTQLYRSFDIRHEQSRHIIYSTLISCIIADVGAYFELLIMNFNEANRSSLMPESGDLGCLAIALLLQLVWIMLFTRSAKFLYYRMTPPRKCCIVTGGAADRAYMLSKLAGYKKRYLITAVLNAAQPNLESAIEGYEHVFLYDLPCEERMRLIEHCYKIGKPVHYGMELGDVIALGAAHDILSDAPFMAVDKAGLTLEQRIAKRTMDIIFSVCALIVASPIMLACALAIRIEDGGPIIFRQQRATRGGEIFEIYKFRTMRPDAQRDKSATDDDQRITKVGAFLRRYRLDELPQFVNILKGEMSVVGPRPEMLSNVRDYTRALPEFSYRLRVKAGLTGYAQIAGKYNTLPKDKMLLDLMYIENYSLWEDIKLVFKTATVFYRGDSTEAFHEPNAANDGAANTGAAKSDSSVKNDASRAG